MCYKQNRGFKSKRIERGCRNKWIERINKAYLMYISCECKCRFDRRKCNSDQLWNNDKYQCECKQRNLCGKDNIWNSATCSHENGKYLASIMDDSVITCDKIIELCDDETNFNEKKATC